MSKLNAHTTRTPKTNCPCCGAPIDEATNFDEKVRKPQPGSISICSTCLELLIFNDDLTQRKLKPAEYKALSPEMHADISKLRSTVRAVRRAMANAPRDTFR